MTKRTVVQAICNVTGQELEHPNTVSLNLGEGVTYALDLGDEPYAELVRVLQPYTDVADVIKGRTVTQGSTSGGSSADPEIQKMREWGRENGFDVPTHGRLPGEIREAYVAANPGV